MNHHTPPPLRRRLTRLATLAFCLVACLGLVAPAAQAATRVDTGTFTFTDHFVTEPGEQTGCAFPVVTDQVGHGSYQVMFDASGEPTRVIVHLVWTGVSTANGKTVIEHSTQTETFDLVSGTETVVGGIHVQVAGQRVLIHDVGILRFDADGTLLFEAGQLNGFDGDPVAIARLCAALA